MRQRSVSGKFRKTRVHFNDQFSVDRRSFSESLILAGTHHSENLFQHSKVNKQRKPYKVVCEEAVRSDRISLSERGMFLFVSAVVVVGVENAIQFTMNFV